MSPTTPPPAYPASEPRRRRQRQSRSWSVPLGRIAGIEIRAHLSFLALIVLVALGATAPGQPAVVEQVAWLLVLFMCVVAHELAHSLVARAHGVRVREIELLPIGGISKLESRPTSPRDELLISAAGPAMSFLIGATVAALVMAAGNPPWPIAIYDGSLLTRIVWVNVLLGGFNLLPALPLDGGRVLRAALTPRLGHERATRLTASAGRVAGVLLIAIGFLWNVWLAVIGVFVVFGAVAEEAALRIEVLLADVRVRDLPLHPPPEPLTALTVDADELIVRTPLLSGARSVAVMRDGVVVGVVYADDLERVLRSAAKRRRDLVP